MAEFIRPLADFGSGVAEFLPPTPSFRHALARTALFFGGIGGRANFIGAPPQNFKMEYLQDL